MLVEVVSVEDVTALRPTTRAHTLGDQHFERLEVVAGPGGCPRAMPTVAMMGGTIWVVGRIRMEE